MDSATGVFTVPVTGIYAFSFSAYFYLMHPYTGVFIYKNGEYQFRIHDQNFADFPHYDNIGNTWTMSLLQNDQIHLKVEGNPLVFNPSYVSEFVSFNGQLLMKQ